MNLEAELGNLADEELSYVFERSQTLSNRQACRRAGIAESTFYSWPEEQRAGLNELAQQLKRDRLVAAHMVLMKSAEEYARRLSEQALFSLEDFIDIDEDGKPILNLHKAAERGRLHLVKKLWQNSDGHWRIEFYDAQQAILSALDRTVGRPAQKHEVGGEAGEPIRFVAIGGLDPNEDF